MISKNRIISRESLWIQNSAPEGAEEEYTMVWNRRFPDIDELLNK